MTMRLKRHNAPELAYNRISGTNPCIIFAPGFQSHRKGTKALHLHAWAEARGQAAIFYDPRGHGESDGHPADTTPSRLLADLQDMIDGSEASSVVIVGSSMGGLVALHAVLAGNRPIAGAILIAPALHFQTRLRQRLADVQLAEIAQTGVTRIDTPYDPEGYIVSRAMLEDPLGQAMPDSAGALDLPCPVTIIHGMQDDVVPWQGSLALCERTARASCDLVLIRDGDHRLSDAASLSRLSMELDRMMARIRRPDPD